MKKIKQQNNAALVPMERASGGTGSDSPDEVDTTFKCYVSNYKVCCNQCLEITTPGGLYIHTGKQQFCLKCKALSEHVLVRAGNAKLTRLANKFSSKKAVVYEFGDWGKQRIGVMVEPGAIDKVRTLHPDLAVSKAKQTPVKESALDIPR